MVSMVIKDEWQEETWFGNVKGVTLIFLVMPEEIPRIYCSIGQAGFKS
jgi:hypothetical protein